MLRNRRALIAAATAVVVIAGAVVGYRWITSSRPVTSESAVQRYRSDHQTLALPTTTPVATAAPTLARPTSAKVAGVTRVASRPQAASTPTKSSWWNPPPSGVYSYDTTGYEKATFSRNYPKQTQRIIDTSGGSYQNHHIFSQEHEEWFTLHPGARGGEMLTRRMRVTFGPVTVDQTVPFNPGVVGVAVPFQLGRTWSGSWKGDTSGTYTGKTIDHRTLRIGGEDVEVWVSELKLQMSGKVSGTVDTKLWYAPKLGLDAREDGIYNIRSQGTPGTYHTEYTITLASTHPQR